MAEDIGITGDENSHLLYFYGTECTHCHEMNPLHEKLAEEEGLKLKKIEMWHHAENAKYYKELEDGHCGAVPFYFNLETKAFICGNCDYKRLKAWAKGE